MLDSDGFEDNTAVLEVKSMLENAVLQGISGHKRSQQVVIGPSGLGCECPRKLAYQLATTERPYRDPATGWSAFVGTAMHEKLEEVINLFSFREDLTVLTEQKVSVGSIYIPGQGMTEIKGTCDVYIGCPESGWGVVIDWKGGGVTSLRKRRKIGIEPQYRYQVHLYGRGFIKMGYPVTDVAVFSLPQGGRWIDRYWWSEEYDESLVSKVLHRATTYGAAIDEHGLESVLECLQPVEDHCDFCPFGIPGTNMPLCPTTN